MLELRALENDDPSYLGKVQRLINGAVTACAAESVTAVRIDTWFGRNWFGFSHKVMGAFGVAYHDHLVVPPFVPNRVTFEQTWLRRGAAFVTVSGDPPLHVSQTSEANRHRSVHELHPRRAFVWWCGASADTGRGAVMAYLPSSATHIGWYAGLSRTNGWQWADLRRITREELQVLGGPTIAGGPVVGR